jgi:hypothetical protein
MRPDPSAGPDAPPGHPDRECRELDEAFRYYGSGLREGKIVVNVGGDD